MKKFISAAIVAIVSVLAVTLSACGAETVQSAKKKYEDSLEKVKTVVTTVDYTDGGVSIYSEKRTLEFGGEATLTVEKTQLDAITYKPVTKTTSEKTDVKRSGLKAVELDETLIDSGYSIENGVISGSVSGERVKKFFGGELPAFGSVAFKITLSDKKVASIEYSFTTLEMKHAEVKISYAY